MIILITNDDGIESEGLHAIKEAAKELGDVWVVATSEDRSGSSHSISITRAIRVKQIGKREFKVDGTPTDCVNIAVNGLLPERPDIVISGINIGENVGDDILYSGTFGGAIEGALLGIPSFAISARERDGKPSDLRKIAEISIEIIKFTLENPLPKRVVQNINFPYFKSPKDIKGIKFGKLCRRVYGEKALLFQDPRGRDFWFIGGKELKVDTNGYEDISNLDVSLLDKGFISITPVKVEYKTESWVENAEEFLTKRVEKLLR